MAKFWAINEKIMYYHSSNHRSNHTMVMTIVTTMVTVINLGYHHSN